MDLNGPVLSFTLQPVGLGTTVASGSVTLTGIATASFIGIQTPDNTGDITYQWYKNDVALTDGTNVVGSATTELNANLQSTT